MGFLRSVHHQISSKKRWKDLSKLCSIYIYILFQTLSYYASLRCFFNLTQLKDFTNRKLFAAVPPSCRSWARPIPGHPKSWLWLWIVSRWKIHWKYMKIQSRNGWELGVQYPYFRKPPYGRHSDYGSISCQHCAHNFNRVQQS
jgi:hypothetical protein